LETKTSEAIVIKWAFNRATVIVHHTFTLPASWDKGIGPFRKAFMQGTENFYQNTWNTINKGDNK
jgi:hypothetical protein